MIGLSIELWVIWSMRFTAACIKATLPPEMKK